MKTKSWVIEIKVTGFSLIEVLIAIVLVSLVAIGYLQMVWWVLHRQRDAIYWQQAYFILWSLEERAGTEDEIASCIANKLPQGELNFSDGQWQIKWQGGQLISSL